MTAPIRVILIDDEDLARQMLKEYLAGYDGITVIAECSNGKEAVDAIHAHNPDLIFLDVQMPELSGFDLLTKLQTIPFIIFSTAYDKYALQAFEVNAVDYLLKPFDRARFDHAMERALERIQGKEDPVQRLQALLNTLPSDKTEPKRFWIKEKGTLKPIRHEEIDWIEAMDDYACLHVGEGSYLVSNTMRDLETQLGQESFMRIHRSTIVNLDRIKELRPGGDGSYKVILLDGTKLALSRGQAKKLKDLVL